MSKCRRAMKCHLVIIMNGINSVNSYGTMYWVYYHIVLSLQNKDMNIIWYTTFKTKEIILYTSICLIHFFKIIIYMILSDVK